jgi:4-carboxymuconolactone decarboxylase
MTTGGRRLRKMPVSELTPDQRAVYAQIVDGPRARDRSFALTDDAGGLEGPFNAMLLSPGLGAALQAVGSEIRFGSTLSAREREIAILVVAGAWHSEFEIYAHEAIARGVGLTRAELDAVSSGQPDQLADEREALVGTTALTLATRADLTDDEYDTAVGQLGAQALFELSTLVGYYSTLALQLRIFRVPVPLNRPPLPG